MCKSFITTLFIIVFIVTFKLAEANRRGGWNGGGNRWKQVGGGGFNSWRQQTFKHNNRQNFGSSNYNNDNTNSFNNRYDNYNPQSYNTFRNPEYNSGVPDADVPTINFSHSQTQTGCPIPTMGDTSKFELRCVFPDSNQDEDCSVAGSFLSSGTTAMLRCKPPYVSDTGDLRIWACESGVWKGEFKAISCTHPPIPIHDADNSFREDTHNKPTTNNYHFQKPTSSWNQNQNSWKPEKSTGDSDWQQSGNTASKPLIPGLIPGLLDQVTAKLPEILEAIDVTSAEDTVQPPWYSLLEKWKPPTTSSTSTTTTTPPTTTTTTPKPLPYLPPPKWEPSQIDWNAYLTENSETTLEGFPSWYSRLERWNTTYNEKTILPSTTTATTTPSTTTTTTTTTTLPTTTTTTTTSTTPKPLPYLPPQEPPQLDWNSFLNQKKEENKAKCPSLSKRTGIQLECLSKSPVPWDPSSFLVSQSDCSTPQVVGTEATYKCEQYYEPSLGLTIQYRKCKEDGTWSGGENRFSCALECGKSNPVGRIPLITNGEPTYKAQWPWHAALYYQDRRRGKFQFDYNCGATLINRKVAITAAHCVTEIHSKSTKEVTQFRIDLGRYERTVEDEYVQTFAVQDVIPHPSYNPVSFDSDLAIIILKSTVSVGFHVRPICYPQTQNTAFEELQLSDGSYGTVVGFGKNENGELSNILHMARLKVVSQQECSASFSDTNFGAGLTKSTTFCAGLKNGTNVCSGDSGGGIFFPVSSGGTSRWYLQGIVSVGITSPDGSNKCDPTRFSVFTRVSPYADWIIRVLSDKDAL